MLDKIAYLIIVKSIELWKTRDQIQDDIFQHVTEVVQKYLNEGQPSDKIDSTQLNLGPNFVSSSSSSLSQKDDWAFSSTASSVSHLREARRKNELREELKEKIGEVLAGYQNIGDIPSHASLKNFKDIKEEQKRQLEALRKRAEEEAKRYLKEKENEVYPFQFASKPSPWPSRRKGKK